MSREIKFRVWDGQMFWHSELVIPRKIRGEGPSEYLLFQIYIYQQWTGALDKNQKQIFEGDIVLFDNPDPYDGQDQLTKIVGYNSRVMGFRLYNFTHEVDKYGGQVFFPEEVEVIGNIFEGAIKDGINYGEYLKEK